MSLSRPFVGQHVADSVTDHMALRVTFTFEKIFKPALTIEPG